MGCRFTSNLSREVHAKTNAETTVAETTVAETTGAKPPFATRSEKLLHCNLLTKQTEDDVVRVGMCITGTKAE
jgi:hypothetical protein